MFQIISIALLLPSVFASGLSEVFDLPGAGDLPASDPRVEAAYDAQCKLDSAAVQAYVEDKNVSAAEQALRRDLPKRPTPLDELLKKDQSFRCDCFR